MSSSNGSGRFSDTLTDATDDDAGGGGDAAYVRRAHHSGSWYPADELDGMLSKFLADAEEEESDDGGGSGGGAGAGSSSRLGAGSVPNACISPHAGYRYSGPTAAHSFLALREALVRNPSLKTIVVVSAKACPCFDLHCTCRHQFSDYDCVHCLRCLFGRCSFIRHIMCTLMDVHFQVRAKFQ